MSKNKLKEWLEYIRDVALTICIVNVAGMSLIGFGFLVGAFIGLLMK